MDIIVIKVNAQTDGRQFDMYTIRSPCEPLAQVSL